MSSALGKRDYPKYQSEEGSIIKSLAQWLNHEKGQSLKSLHVDDEDVTVEIFPFYFRTLLFRQPGLPPFFVFLSVRCSCNYQHFSFTATEYANYVVYISFYPSPSAPSFQNI